MTNVCYFQKTILMKGMDIKMKKIFEKLAVSVTLIIVIVINGTMTSYAAEQVNYYENGYVTIDENAYYYDFDENRNPYIIKNSEVLYLALPLEHLQVTDEQVIEKLNETFHRAELSRAIPGSYYDISDNDSTEKINSSIYSASVNFDQTATFTTSVLKVNRQHATVRFKTSDIKKENIFAGTKVNFTFYYYDIVEDKWYQQVYSEKDCTGTTGFGIIFSPTITQYLKFDVSKASKIKSLKLEVWTTGLW